MAIGENIRFDGDALADNPFRGETAAVDLGFNILDNDPAAASIKAARRKLISGQRI
jgi:hypothetical protein